MSETHMNTSSQHTSSLTSSKFALALAAAILAAAFLLLSFAPRSASAWSTAPTGIAGYAWSDTVGWISLNCLNQGPSGCVGPAGKWGITVSTSSILGNYGWSDNIGWVSAQSSDVAGCPVGLCTAKMSSGVLTGWFRALSADNNGWDGYINLAGTGYGVTYTGNNFNPCNATTQSCAWGSDVVGWVDFSYAFPLCTADTKQECTGAGLQTISSTTIDMYCNITTKNTDTCSLPGKCLDGSSECVYPPPDFLISATPLLVNSGATTTISWGSNGGGDVVGLKNCNVTTNPNNGDSWSGLSGSKTSSPIKQVIVYTLACKSVDPLDPNTYGGSVRVGIVPRFHEH